MVIGDHRVPLKTLPIKSCRVQPNQALSSSCFLLVPWVVIKKKSTKFVTCQVVLKNLFRTFLFLDVGKVYATYWCNNICRV